MAWTRTAPNELPTGPGGGLARLNEWVPVDPAGQQISARTITATGRLNMPPAELLATAPAAFLYPPNMPSSPGTEWTAAVTASNTATIRLDWVDTDGNQQTGGSSSHTGAGRPATTGMQPAGTVGPIITIAAAEGTSLQDPTASRTATDPGPLPPTPGSARLVRAAIPAVHLPDEPGTPQTFFDAAAGMLNQALDTIDGATDGTITSPATAPTGWVRWLARYLGAQQENTIEDTRLSIIHRGQTPAVGSYAAVANAVKRYLTGTKASIAQPTPGQPWTITIGIRPDEAPNGLPAVAQAITDSGRLPAGMNVKIEVIHADWDTQDAELPKWADWKDRTWINFESVGVLSP